MPPKDIAAPSGGRQPISVKIRFEVFKRDRFICQYCGAHPPEVILEVDHIVAVANGGTNDPDNLTTACWNCNRGKGARPLDAIPISLADKATLVSEREAQLAGYSAILEARRQRIEDEAWRVIEKLTGEDEIASDKFVSIKRFIEKIGVHEVLEAVDITKAGNVRPAGQFTYFCKVCWNKVRAQGDG